MIDQPTLVAAIMELRQQIDFLWQFFVTVHIAIFALLFIYDHAVESMNFIARVFAVAGVAIFEWINGNAIAGCYRLMDAMTAQYRNIISEEKFHPDFVREFIQISFADRPELIKITHGMAFAVVILAFISSSFIQSRKRAKA